MATTDGAMMQHIRRSIEELRRYIAASKVRTELEEVDALLAVALAEVRRKLAASETQKARRSSSGEKRQGPKPDGQGS